MEPKIRLKGFSGEWTNSVIGDIATFSKGRGYSKSDLCSEGTPIVLYGKLYTNYCSVIESVDTFASIQNGSVLSKGNEVIIPGSGETPEDIAVAAAVEQKGVILGGDLNIVTFDQEKIVPAFAAVSITNSNTHYELSGYAQGKTVVHLHNSSISKGHISYPSIDEQKAIVSYVSSLDTLIQSTTKKLDKLRTVKAASLQSLFPQEGEMVPRVRFKGFSGEWKREYAYDLFKTFDERNKPELPVLSATQDKGMVTRESYGYNIFHDKSNESTYKHILPGQFVIHLRSFQGGFAYSEIEGIASPAYTVFEFKDKDLQCGIFWKYIFKDKSFVKRLELITYGIRDGRSISFEEFKLMDFIVPSVDEQKKIASYLQSLDTQISLEEKRLEKLRNIKAACLDNMFV